MNNELMYTPKLGFGLMRLPEQDGEIDLSRVNRMVDTFMENGFTYFDTAYIYHGGKSEGAFRKAVVERYPRNQYTIADKLPSWVLKEKADVQKVFDEQLARTGAGYFDFYLLHAIETGHLPTYNDLGCWEFAQEMKQKGLIRHFGFSFHDKPELLDQVLTDHPETEFVQLQINYFDWENEAIAARRCYEIARKHNKPIIVMEPVKGGALASLHAGLEEKLRAAAPEKSVASWALRFCATLDGVMTVLSGMSTQEQTDDNIRIFKNLAPFTGTEKACLDEVAAALHDAPTVGCTACRYCVDGCPSEIKIPDLIREYNSALTYGANGRTRGTFDELSANGHGAAACVECGQCEGVCPQHLPIPSILKKADALFGA